MKLTGDTVFALCALAYCSLFCSFCPPCVLCVRERQAPRCSEYENNMFCRSDAGLLPIVMTTRTTNASLFVCNDQRLTGLTANRLWSRNITRLYLDDNRIERIARGTFRRIRNTSLLSLTHNRLDAIDPLVFAPLVRLRSLDLSYNPIHTVASTFKNLKSLRWLGLSYTDLRSLRFLAALVAVKPKSAHRLTVNGSNNYQLDKLDADTVSAGLRLKSLILVNNTHMRCHCIGNDVWYSCVLTTVDYSSKWPTFIRNCYNNSGGGGTYKIDSRRAGKNDADEWYNDRDEDVSAGFDDVSVVYDDDEPDVMVYAAASSTRESVTESRLVEKDSGVGAAVTPWIALSAVTTLTGVALALFFAAFGYHRFRSKRAAGTVEAETREAACQFSNSNLSHCTRQSLPPPKYSSVGYEYTTYPDVELPTLKDYQMGLYDAPPSPRPFTVEAGLKLKVMATRPLPATPSDRKTTRRDRDRAEPAYVKLDSGDDDDDHFIDGDAKEHEWTVTYTDMSKKRPVVVTSSTETEKK